MLTPHSRIHSRTGSSIAAVDPQKVADLVGNVDIKECLRRVEVNRFKRNEIFWGSAQSFVGMERPIIIVVGFEHCDDAILIQQRNDEIDHSTHDRKVNFSQVRNLAAVNFEVYQAVTR